MLKDRVKILRTDYETGSFIGHGEDVAFEIPKNLTHLKYRTLKQYPNYDGIYRQVPIQWLVHQHDYEMLSQAHKNGSIDILIKLGQRKVCVRVQGKGHGSGLQGLGKALHDKVQKELLEKYCQVVDVNYFNCKELFKDRLTEQSTKELENEFSTAKVEMPTA